MLALFRAARAGSPDTLSGLDAASDALAACLQHNGFLHGDRLGTDSAGSPAHPVALLAAWKVGGCAVPVDPAATAAELTDLLADSGAAALLCRAERYPVVREVLGSGRTRVHTVLTAPAVHWRTVAGEQVLTGSGRSRLDGTLDLLDVLVLHRGEQPLATEPTPDDVAVLRHPPGAADTHRALVRQVRRGLVPPWG